jgi:hypothetical protein
MSSRQYSSGEDFSPVRRRQPRTTSADDADTRADEESEEGIEEKWPDRLQRTPSSAIRFDRLRQPPLPPEAEIRRNPRIPARTHATTEPFPAQHPGSRPNRGLVPAARQDTLPARRRRWHPLFFVGLALCTMVLGFLLIRAVSGWWQGTLDQWQYGYPRTFQTDAVVGHNDSETNPTHFIAINLHGHVQVIEYPGGDITHARLYVGPTLLGVSNDLAPVTLSFRDVNGDGKLDMIISAGSTITVMINDAGQFRPLKPGEQVTL